MSLGLKMYNSSEVRHCSICCQLVLAVQLPYSCDFQDLTGALGSLSSLVVTDVKGLALGKGVNFIRLYDIKPQDSILPGFRSIQSICPDIRTHT